MEASASYHKMSTNSIQGSPLLSLSQYSRRSGLGGTNSASIKSLANIQGGASEEDEDSFPLRVIRESNVSVISLLMIVLIPVFLM